MNGAPDYKLTWRGRVVDTMTQEDLVKAMYRMQEMVRERDAKIRALENEKIELMFGRTR